MKLLSVKINIGVTIYEIVVSLYLKYIEGLRKMDILYEFCYCNLCVYIENWGS